MSTPCSQSLRSTRLVVSEYEVLKVLVSQKWSFFLSKTPCSYCITQSVTRRMWDNQEPSTNKLQPVKKTFCSWPAKAMPACHWHNPFHHGDKGITLGHKCGIEPRRLCGVWRRRILDDWYSTFLPFPFFITKCMCGGPQAARVLHISNARHFNTH